MFNIVTKYLSTAVLLTLAISPPGFARVEFGKPGEPINLIVGYQPYYTGAWSAVVNHHKQFWKKYLPAGSTVEFQPSMQGSVIVKNMMEGKPHLGYVGDMPGIEATFRYLKPRGGVDIRIIAVTSTSQQICNTLLVQNEAPTFATGKDAVQWLEGKTIAASHGTCTDLFVRFILSETGVKPKEYLNQNIEVITANLRTGKLDAAAVWEPIASKLVQAGLAKRAATGKDFNTLDAGMLVMLNDLIEQRPDIQKAWLQAELDAQLFLADPAHAKEVIDMVKSQVTDIDEKALWEALYGEHTATTGQASEINLQFDFIVNDRVQKMLDEATLFLNSLPKKPAAEPKIREGGISDDLARQVLKERGLESPVGVVRAENEKIEN